ncbi:hypothetical protein [Helicobacter mesocricetorum]|uniref:hypothetical protein n=1 Tax=Helicobacter mesocricetorum TaxID=87012 RepID=UPI000CF14E6B|nr:hypothetical protein [Helicobacter mesocricetorum]
MKDLDYQLVDFLATTKQDKDFFTHYLHLISPQEIHKIKLTFNENILEKINISISYNGVHYLNIFHKDYIQENALLVKNPFKGNIASIKIEIFKGNIKNIQTIKILSRKYDRLIIAARTDGIGARMIALLNNIYLSNLLGERTKFGFVWKDNFPSDTLRSMRNQNEIEGNKISGLGLENEEVIFTQDFIENFSYTNNLLGCNDSYHIGNNLQDFVRLSTEATDTKEAFLFSPPTPLYNIEKLKEMIKECDYRRGLREIWDTLEFVPRIKRVIETAKELALQNHPFVAIHIRSGDVIFTPTYRNSLDRMLYHTLPLELAMACIETELKEGNKAILFSDDFSSMYILLDYFKKEDLHFIESLVPATFNLNNLERVFFEITFMSFSKKIYTSKTSVYARLAHYIGENSILLNSYEVFNEEQRYQYLQKYSINPNRFQKALSNFHKFVLSRNLGIDYDIQETHIKDCINTDKENLLFKMLFIDLLLETKRYSKADEILDDIVNKYQLNFIEMLLLPYHISNKERYLTISVDNHQYPNIATITLALKTSKTPTLKQPFLSASSRLKSHLAYKLGEAMIDNSKSLLGYIRMPYVLSYIKDKHNKEQKQYQEKIKKNPNLKLPPLESYSDYKEGLKIKRSLSYKLGEALIKANSVRGGGANIQTFICLPCILPRSA